MKNIVLKSITALSLALTTSLSFAANIGDTATNVGTQINSITSLMVIAATLLGIVFLIVGGVNLKKHGDNPQQVPIGKPLIFLASGALLFGLGSTSDVLQETLFNDTGNRDSGGTAGTFGDFD